MSKKNDMSSLKNIGAGILDSLNGVKEEESNNTMDKNNKTVEEEKNNTVNTYEGKTVLEEIDSTSKEEQVNNHQSNNIINHKNSKSVKGKKEKKSKRSFMLNDDTINRIDLLKLCMNDKALSEIVEEAVELYFNKNKKSVENLIKIYDSVK